MQVILLEKIRNLGNIGDTAKVKPGYARNFLLPQSKAVTATKENVAKFATLKEELEKKAAAVLAEAQARVGALEKIAVTIAMRATEEGKLFGSVSTREVVEAIIQAGGKVDKKEVILPKGPIHELGEHEIRIQLHTDVIFPMKVNIVTEK